MAHDKPEYLLTVFFVGGSGQQFLTLLRPSEVRAKFRNPDQGWISIDAFAPNPMKQPIVFEVMSIHVQGFAIGEAVQQSIVPPGKPSIIGVQ